MPRRIACFVWVYLLISLGTVDAFAQQAPKRLLLQDIVPQGVPEPLARSLTDSLEIVAESRFATCKISWRPSPTPRSQ